MPSGRAMIRSSSSPLSKLIGPLTMSFQLVAPSIGLRKRITGLRSAGTGGRVLPGSGRQVPS
ncbi:Uncharacterised protein [Bordetella pertussis]|nr:Uncharacterised protein [Bordetella pertussis]CFW03439.1 Uncharacterised protein [Bordetella pertussis]CFW43220.1 Uncharacterised protein [Bordetella pertussis]